MQLYQMDSQNSAEKKIMGKKLKKAARSNIKLALILGGDELAKNTVQMRNLKTGSQTEIAIADIADVVAAALLAP